VKSLTLIARFEAGFSSLYIAANSCRVLWTHGFQTERGTCAD